MNINDICWLLMSYLFSPNASVGYQKKISRSIPQRMNVCKQVAKEAKRQNINPILATAVAYQETRFSNITSHKGAKGPLGVIPKYHCDKNPCDYTKAGIHALKKFIALNPQNMCDALAQYNAGLKATCQQNSPATTYAQRTLDLVYEIKHFNQKKCYQNPIK